MTPEALVHALRDRYRIERELGQGGMANVYLARDLRHDRRVAVKVLRPELAAVIGADRFLSEIKTTANLQHPHILPLFDSGRTGGQEDGRSDDFLYYVMPYIEGESLRDRLTREKQLPIADAVRIATEVAGALDYAHRHGVIHRDIKPENILLHDGRALVADFGIALAASKAGGTRMTETGMSLGTPHYMSPEQAMGEKEITPAADTYALGCVLYEMLTGEPPFTGPTAQAIVAKLLTSEPEPATTLRKTVPSHVEAALETALQKIPADRFQSAKAFGDALGDAAAGGTTTARRGARVQATSSRRSLYVTLGLCAVLLAVALIGWLRPRRTAETSRQRVELWRYALGKLLDPGLALEATQAALAPDGSSIVYTDSIEGHLQLMRKARDASVATPIAGTEGGLSPFFSPDGHWIGFSTADGSLKKVPVEGGGAVALAHRGDPTYTAAAWLDDGSIVYGGGVGVYQISASGETRQVLPDTVRERPIALTIAPLPGARGVLYTACPDNCSIRSDVHILDLKGHSDRILVVNAAGAWYSPTGHLLYTDRAGGLYAEQFDLDRLRATSGPVPVIDGVVPGSFALTRAGTALYATAAAAGTPAELDWVARDGSATPFDSTWHGDFQYPALSPDGRTLAVSVREGTTQLWVRRSDGARQRLTEEGTTNWRPAWTPDGKSIAFSSNRSSGTAARDVFNLYQVPADGSAPARLLLHHTFGVWEGEFSSDGRWLVMRSDEQGNISHIYGRRLAGDTALVPLVVDTTISYQIAISPDGRWLAYCGLATGRAEIYVAPFPGMSPTRLVSRDGGSEPRWSRNGQELFYRSRSRFMAVPASGPTLTLGSPRELFSAAAYRAARNRPEYDVAPDGRHFLMIRDLPGSGIDVVYVENWFPELLAKVKR